MEKLNYGISMILSIFGIYNIINHNYGNVVCFVMLGCFGIIVQSFIAYLMELDRRR